MLNLQLADHTADVWATAFNEAAPAILGGLAAGELHALEEDGDPRHEAAFTDAAFRLWTAKFKVGGWRGGGFETRFRVQA